MRGDRPQNLLALALASLALALAVWWAFDTFSGSDPATSPDATVEIPPTWLEPDPAPEKPKTTPTPVAPPKRGRDLEPPRPPGLPPPERIQPDVLPPPDDDGANQPEAGFIPPEDGETKDEKRPDFASGAFSTWLLGGVARTSARASREVRIEEGTAIIGSPLTYVRGLGAAPRVGNYVALEMEAPRHRVLLEEYFIDRFEVRNFDYFLYLNRTARIFYNTSDHPDRTLAQIIEYLVPERPVGAHVLELAARQLFFSNRLALLTAWESLVVKNRDQVIDVDKTYERVREREVPRDVRLIFYDRLPPAVWPGAEFGSLRGDYPVRGLALEEALEYAQYRGRHIPSEQQWEYAARGPQGLEFPWDKRGKDFKFNVNGGQAIARGEQPETRPVTHYPGGTSWIGCFNMLGNVSEWTSSYLDPYPDGVQSAGLVPGTDIVVRGGSVNDRERWGLRPSRRSWLAGDADGPPRTNVRREWTGIRTARWEEPARSRVPSMHVRARSRTRIDPAVLEKRIFVGWQGVQTRTFERFAGEDLRAKPRPGVKTLVAQPLQVLSTRSALDGWYRANSDVTLADPVQLLEQSLVAPVLLGLLHVDMHVLDTWATRARRPVSGPLTEPLRRTDMRPGTYFLVLSNGLVGFLRTDRREIYFASNRAPPKATLSVIDRAYIKGTQRRPTVKLQFDHKTRAELNLVVPTHRDGEPGFAVTLRLRIAVDPRETALIESFERGRILK